MSIDDATLMAFADGELSEARTAEVAVAVAADPALAARVERFRMVRARLAGSLDGLAPRADLLARAEQAQAAGPNPVRIWGPALAASLAGLVIGAAAVMSLRPAGDLGPDMAAQGGLVAVLERTPSGTATAGVEPLYSVVAADGRACRAFRTIGGRGYEGVACREGDGWRVLALAEAPRRLPGYSQASGHEAVAVGAALDGVQAGEPLSAAAEAALIRRGWRE